MAVYIYGLVCPKLGSFRYIGKSTNPEARLRAHISSARRGAYDHHTARWISSLLNDGLRPTLEVIQEIEEGECWREAERKWIKKALDEGLPLTNSTLGGEGLDYLDPEEKSRYLDNLSKAMQRYRNTRDGAEKFEKFLISSRSEETAKKRLAGIIRSSKRPEFIDLMRRVGSDINSRPEVIAAKSEKSKRMWKDQAKREEIIRAINAPECKERMSKARAAAWADPIIGKKLRESRSSPEYRKKLSDSMKAVWEKRRASNQSKDKS